MRIFSIILITLLLVNPICGLFVQNKITNQNPSSEMLFIELNYNGVIFEGEATRRVTLRLKSGGNKISEMDYISGINNFTFLQVFLFHGVPPTSLLKYLRLSRSNSSGIPLSGK